MTVGNNKHIKIDKKNRQGHMLELEIYQMLGSLILHPVLFTHPNGNVSNPSIVRFSLIVDLILLDMCVVMMSFVLVSHLN